MSDEARFARAEREYLEPPDDDGEECEWCSGDGVAVCTNPDHGFISGIGGELSKLGCPCCGHDPDHKMHGNDCENCDGTGYISKAKARQDFLNAKADHDYQAWKDRKLEEK